MSAIRSWAPGLVAIAVLAIPAAARAEVPVYSESEFLSRVVAAAPALTAAEARGRAADAAIGAAGRRSNPSVAWEHDELPGSGGLDRLTVTVPLDLTPRRAAGRRAAALEADAVRAEAARQRRQLETDARRAYARAAAARQERIALEAARAIIDALATRMTAQASAGLASGYDADRVGLELALVDDELAAARGAEAVAESALGAWLGLATPVGAADPLVAPARPTAPAVAPEVGAVEDARAAARRAEAATSARPWARFDVTAGALYERSGDERALGFTLGVAVPLPLLDDGRAAARHARAEAAALDADRVARREVAGRAVTTAAVAVAAAIEQLERFRAGPAAIAARLVASVDVAYREGDRSLLELLDALRAERAIARRTIELTLAARLAAIDLTAVAGGVQ